MFLKIGVSILAIIVGVVSAGLIALFQAGIATVYVENEDVSLFLPVPVALANISLAFVPEKELKDIRRELEPFKKTIKAALLELRNTPNATLLEVRASDENVIVRTEDGELVVRVDTGNGDKVRVRLPLRAVHHLLAAVAG